MSVKTKVYLLGHVTVPKLLDFLKDYQPVSDVCHTQHEMLPEAIQSVYHKYDDEKWYADYGFISFNMPNGVRRHLFYSYSNVIFCNNAGCYYPPEAREIVESETTDLSLECDEAAIQIMKEIVSYFGGWIKEMTVMIKSRFTLSQAPGQRIKRPGSFCQVISSSISNGSYIPKDRNSFIRSSGRPCTRKPKKP